MTPNADLLINLAFLRQKPTGMSTYAKNLLPHLQALSPLLLSAQAQPGFQHYPIPANLTAEHGSRGQVRRILWTQFDLPRLYRQAEAKLLFSMLPELPLHWLGIGWQGRSVVTVFDFIPRRFAQPRSLLSLYFRYYIPQVLQQADHIICISEATARDAAHFCQVPAQKLTAIPLAYDAEHFQPLNLEHQNYFLSIGRPDPHKNLSRLVTAFARVAQTCDVELWLVGKPDQRYTPQLQAQAQELGVDERVRWLDYVAYADLPRLINQAIALVFPSLWEGFGLPVLEAMACGTPVITSNCSSLPEVAGDAAWLVNPYDPQEIAAAMQAIAMETSTRQQLQAAGLERVKQFNWAQTGAATAAVLEKYL